MSGLAKSILAAVAVTFLLSGAAYVYLLNSKVALETANRQRVQAALDQAATLAVAMKQELVEARRESDRRLADLSAMKETVTRREAAIERLRAQLGQKESELSSLYKTASPKDEMLIMLQSSGVRVLPLSGTDAAKGAGGLILYDAERSKAFLYAFNLPALPRGKVYQFWAITTKPVGAGTFDADSGRKARHLARGLPAKSGLTKFAVSVEPAGGRPQPTGPFFLRGSL